MNGFTAVITNKEFIESRKQDKAVKEFTDKISSFPSVNGPGFDRSAFNRWISAYIIAKELNVKICTSECDVINYGYSPEMLAKLNTGNINIADRDGCPVLGYGNVDAFRYLITKMKDHVLTNEDQFENRSHLSDQDFIIRYVAGSENFTSFANDVASVFTTPLWESFKLVHYGNPFMMGNGINVLNTPKVETIQNIRPITGWDDDFKIMLSSYVDAKTATLSSEYSAKISQIQNENKKLNLILKTINNSKVVKLAKKLGLVHTEDFVGN
jgi:hypothetical protein